MKTYMLSQPAIAQIRRRFIQRTAAFLTIIFGIVTAITVAELSACPDGRVYVAGSIDGEDVQRSYASMSSALRLEDDYSLTVLGIDLGNFDPLAVTCAPSGTLCFTNAQGIYSIPGLGALR